MVRTAATLTTAKAIRARCLDCAELSRPRGAEEAQKSAVANCGYTSCDLYPFRLGRAPRGSGSRLSAIKRHCRWCCNGQLPEVGRCPAVDCPLWTRRGSKRGQNAQESGAKLDSGGVAE